MDGDDEILILAFDKALRVGDGVLVISFCGVLNDHMKGFYRRYSFSFDFVLAVFRSRER